MRIERISAHLQPVDASEPLNTLSLDTEATSADVALQYTLNDPFLNSQQREQYVEEC